MASVECPGLSLEPLYTGPLAPPALYDIAQPVPMPLYNVSIVIVACSALEGRYSLWSLAPVLLYNSLVVLFVRVPHGLGCVCVPASYRTDSPMDYKETRGHYTVV